MSLWIRFLVEEGTVLLLSSELWCVWNVDRYSFEVQTGY